MQIRLVVLTLTNRPSVMLSSLVTTSSPGPPSDRILFLALVLRLNIALLPLLLLRHPGFVNSSVSYSLLCIVPHWSTVATLALSTCQPTLSNINAPSILRLIFTLCGNALLLVMSVFFTFPHHFSMHISSPKGCHLRSSRSFGPA